MTISTSDFASRLQRLTYQLTRYYEVCDRFCSDRIGVPAAQAYTLLALPQNESMTMNDLSEKMGLANSTMTHTVDLLVKKQLVERENDPDDRRVVRVRLSPRGQETRNSLEQTLQGFFEQIAQEIPAEIRSVVLESLQQVNSSVAMVLRSCCDPNNSL